MTSHTPLRVRTGLLEETASSYVHLDVVDPTWLAFPTFDALHAAIAIGCRIGIASTDESGPTDALVRNELDLANENVLDTCFVSGKGRLFRIALPSSTPDVTIDFCNQTGQVTIGAGSEVALTLPKRFAGYLSAPLGTRAEDAFSECRDDEGTFRRRRLWTTACLSAHGALPCSISTFINAAEMIAIAIDPMIGWDNDNRSFQHRLLAAIRAGTAIYDVRSRQLVEHPSTEAWRNLFGPASKDIWPSLGIVAQHIRDFPERLHFALRSWSREMRGQPGATSHQVLAAEEALSRHQREIVRIREELYSRVSPFPMPPPLPRERAMIE